ncbi:MAG: sigma-70 family RNA polymerase sigma factor, partial [Myxococcales bacterium]|nr:sigma-70 family RNA polymerase sigma factor [Myxococcales bacterium]
MTERSEAAEARASAERRAREAELDAGLVARWQAGEREACKELFERYYPNIARFFRTKVRGPGVEEDLVQMTFLRCFEAVSRLREPVAFRSYLFGIACNTLREHYRGARREAELLGAPLSRSVLELAGELGPGPSSLL